MMPQAAKYHNRAALAVEAFQKDDEIGPQDRREAGFEYFVRCLLERLEEHAQLTEVGLSVVSSIQIADEAGAPSIHVRQRLAALCAGVAPEKFEVEAFYAECFPRNAVFDGAFSVRRADPVVQRYLKAAPQDDERTAVIAILSRAAEAAFTAANIRFFFSAA